MSSGGRSPLRHGHELDGSSGVATIEAVRPTLRVVVVMPAYNEEALNEFLSEIEAALSPVTGSLGFVVVDDASTQPVRVNRLPLGAAVDLVRNDRNRGHGPSALRAYAAGLGTGADVVVHVDGDGQFLGHDFAALLDAIEGHDGVIGVRAGRREPWFRRILTAGARVVTGNGLRGGDPNSPLRAYREGALTRLLESVGADSVVPHLHFAILHERLDLDVREIEVTHRVRRGLSPVGTSWQGRRTVAALPSRRLVTLAGRAVQELVRRDYAGPPVTRPDWWRWPVVALVLTAVAAVVVPGFLMSLGFDESYNLQVVTHLLHGHGYSTSGALFGGHTQPFDYRITTGPTLLLPITVAAAVLGEHIWVYRLVPTIASVGLLATWWVVGSRMVAPRFRAFGGAAAVSGVLSLNTVGILYDGRSGTGTVTGETTATLFVLLAIVIARRPGLAGLCLGLAIMTKVLALLAGPGVLLAVCIAAGRSRAPRTVAVFAAAAAAPVLAWQGVRVAALGWSGAMAANGDFVRFLRATGAGSSPSPALHLIEQVLLLGAVAAVIPVAVGLGGARLVQVRGHLMRREDAGLIAGILVAGVALEGYWVVFESQYLVRHSVQAAQLLVPLSLVVLVRVLPSRRKSLLRDLTAIVAAAAVAMQVVATTRAAWTPPGPSLAEQRQVAQLVAERGRTYQFVKTWMVPELIVLNPDLDARRLDASGGLLVLSGNSGKLRTDGCDQVVLHAGYVLCSIAPGPTVRKMNIYLDGERVS